MLFEAPTQVEPNLDQRHRGRQFIAQRLGENILPFLPPSSCSWTSSIPTTLPPEDTVRSYRVFLRWLNPSAPDRKRGDVRKLVNNRANPDMVPDGSSGHLREWFRNLPFDPSDFFSRVTEEQGWWFEYEILAD